MYSVEEIVHAYKRQVELPWSEDVPPAGKIWLLWYDKPTQRRISARMSELENLTRAANHGWIPYDLSQKLSQWLADHDFFEPLMENPMEISGLLPDFESFLINKIGDILSSASSSDVVALEGTASLFGFVRISSLVSNLTPFIKGRLLVTFPGKHTGGIYRFLDARDGWNYHAIPIPGEMQL